MKTVTKEEGVYRAVISTDKVGWFYDNGFFEGKTIEFYKYEKL